MTGHSRAGRDARGDHEGRLQFTQDLRLTAAYAGAGADHDPDRQADRTLAGMRRSRTPIGCPAVCGVSTEGNGGGGIAREISQIAPKVSAHINA